MSASIVFRNQEDIALVDMLAEHSVLQYSISYIAVERSLYSQSIPIVDRKLRGMRIDFVGEVDSREN